MKPDKDTPIMICLPVAWEAVDPAGGNFQRPCVFCQQPVWVSPAGIVRVETEGIVPACAPCVRRELKANPDEPTTYYPMSPAQELELKNAQMRRHVERLGNRHRN